MDLTTWLHGMWYCKGKSLLERQKCEWKKSEFSFKCLFKEKRILECKFYRNGLCKNPKFNRGLF